LDAATESPAASLDRQREVLAGVCRAIGEQFKPSRAPAAAQGVAVDLLSPRMRQTLDRLLAGDSEKEIAARLELSPHTVHVYVKSLYRRLGVSSRGELFAVITGRRTAARPTPNR
jgi:DNA-binding NarL/FixJ family response regulator